MNDKDNKYIFDDEENDELEIAEYLERELDNMEAREKRRSTGRKSKKAGYSREAGSLQENDSAQGSSFSERT